MYRLALRNLVRRPLRNSLAMFGLAMAIAVLTCLSGWESGYRRALGSELDRMGLQLMLVPLGCPYDAAARVLKGKVLDNTLPESALAEARHDPAVGIAAPLLMTSMARPGQGRTDMWVGLDESALALKPWWQVGAGEKWFPSPDSVILGADAAELEMRAVGDFLFSPETGQKLRVTGVLERSGTSDDSMFFVPLHTAQRMFGQAGRLTAVAIRLRDPVLLREASERLQRIPGSQVVTVAEMMGVFLNLVGAAHTLLSSLALIALAVSVLSIFNTLMAAVVERGQELSLLRALGASPAQILSLIGLEALLLAGAGSLAGLLLALALGPPLETVAKHFLPLAPAEPLMSPTALLLAQNLALGAAAGLVGGLVPAWRASRAYPAVAWRGG